MAQGRHGGIVSALHAGRRLGHARQDPARARGAARDGRRLRAWTSFRFGGTPYDVSERGLQLFAKEVLPVVRSWKQEVTAPTPSPVGVSSPRRSALIWFRARRPASAGPSDSRDCQNARVARLRRDDRTDCVREGWPRLLSAEPSGLSGVDRGGLQEPDQIGRVEAHEVAALAAVDEGAREGARSWPPCRSAAPS